jgi:hypothetical protein
VALTTTRPRWAGQRHDQDAGQVPQPVGCVTHVSDVPRVDRNLDVRVRCRHLPKHLDLLIGARVVAEDMLVIDWRQRDAHEVSHGISAQTHIGFFVEARRQDRELSHEASRGVKAWDAAGRGRARRRSVDPSQADGLDIPTAEARPRQPLGFLRTPRRPRRETFMVPFRVPPAPVGAPAPTASAGRARALLADLPESTCRLVSETR